MYSKPHLAVTLGDPAGIGPEVILKALADQSLTSECQITLIGHRKILQQTYEKLHSISSPLAIPDDLNILEVELHENRHKITPGIGNIASGAASFAYLETAITQTLAGKFHAIVTAPIAKTHWKAAGHDYPGQTELLAEKAGIQRFGMLFVAKSPHTNWTLRTLLATTHIPLSQVPKALTPELLSLKLDLLIECLEQDFGIKNPKIAVAGLNPHSGENGQLGTEEKDWMIDWIKQQSDRYPQLQLDGPIPPDTLWVKPGQAWYNSAKNAHDAYLALYHDQGLIPVKLMAFDRAVNTTIGLPFIRTSPDHGTAFDIVGKGIADASSMKAALQFAIELATQRLNETQS
ncbi:MAG: 4-hydroxythreonine-4-phosphate dehydrogenase PdxA [Limnoraphis sp. WC205]|jgi:4-hydroxythreonine-4-phosphate dehydrogenase|nr:4-hydroxythreonine-4-phosphate dehydrogenase PdxA [Limnoraphis sp. WC205]